MDRHEDADAIRLATKLVEFLAEVTESAAKNPVRDILARCKGAPEEFIWLEKLPDGTRVTENARDHVLLRMRPPNRLPQPSPSDGLTGAIDWIGPEGADDRRPTLRAGGDRRAFDKWFAVWQRWSDGERLTAPHRKLYDALENVAKSMEQRDDEYEFVLAVGLLRWAAPDGERIRRHLITEPVTISLDRDTAEVRVRQTGGARRFEDREMLQDQQAYAADRGQGLKSAVTESDFSMLADETMSGVLKWARVALTEPIDAIVDSIDPDDTLPPTAELTASPALLLRPRSRVLLAEAYRCIAGELAKPGAQVPVGLAQLVMETERGQRDRWLGDQGAVRGEVLGADPLFPKETNAEQMRVMDLLRTETGVVVQGPPGTGKTHTIANLISALLARGQRVLVTSQKDQALRVLREKIPSDLRQLCVLLAGGSRDAASELERGLDSLSAAVETNSVESLASDAATLAQRRDQLRGRSAELNNKIRALREAESLEHTALVPGYSPTEYRGRLSEVVRQVVDAQERFGWIPAVPPVATDVPPLSASGAMELGRLLRLDTPARQMRVSQFIPDPTTVPATAAFAGLVDAEKQALELSQPDSSESTRQLARVGVEHLDELASIARQVRPLLRRIGFGTDGSVPDSDFWPARAVADLITGVRGALWDELVQLRSEPDRLLQQIQTQGAHYVIELPAPSQQSLGAARGWLDAGMRLREHLEAGGKLRGIFPPAVQQQAMPLLNNVRINGQSPRTAAQLREVLARLEAEVAALQLVDFWARVGVPVVIGRAEVTLSELADLGRTLVDVYTLAAAHRRAGELIVPIGGEIDLLTPADLTSMLDRVPAALRHIELKTARDQVERLRATMDEWASRSEACPELGLLRDAVARRDTDMFAAALERLNLARHEHGEQVLLRDRSRALQDAHPALMDLLRRTIDDEVWPERLAELPAAWAWSKARGFVESRRSAEEERRLSGEFDATEEMIRRVTEQLAAAQAMHACLARMTDTHARALRTYRQHMRQVGAGMGKKTREFREAARAAMAIAKSAVPAWVVPLPDLLESLPAVKDSFDVVIVDEASQVGLEYLFLLWLAPRVIVVGDDKQCTPGATRMGRLEPVFQRLDEHLGEVDHDIRMHFTPKADLFGLLTSRSGKEAVVRLREHFRCMPQIIGWSSTQFYGEDGLPGLIPLREHTVADLAPLRVVHVADGFTEGRDTKRRNPNEAKRIVEQLVACLNDPRYADKTFGVVVLQGTGQIKLLEHLINKAITPEERQRRKIRVGSPPNFQGDERDVVMLSMVVAETPTAQTATTARQGYNVAASRAKDQMWLFHSVELSQLRARDLRASLLGYMTSPPSSFGRSPGLDEVSETRLVEPFDSLLEQKVFRALKKRGYHVIPQYEVGARRLDLVVVGDGGRMAVECDGHHWHAGIDEQVSDARRDRELRRMGWEVFRVRESEFEFNRDAELAPLWTRFAARGIEPSVAVQVEDGHWSPIALLDDDDSNTENGDYDADDGGEDGR